MDAEDFFEFYPMEVLEASIAIIVIQAIMDKPINYFNLIRLSLVVAAMTYLMKSFNKNYYENFKQGLQQALGYYVLYEFVKAC